MTSKPEQPGTPPKKTTIRHNFEQQDRGLGFSTPHSAPTPQHGQEASKEPLDVRETQSFKPRPGH